MLGVGWGGELGGGCPFGRWGDMDQLGEALTIAMGRFGNSTGLSKTVIP